MGTSKIAGKTGAGGRSQHVLPESLFFPQEEKSNKGGRMEHSANKFRALKFTHYCIYAFFLLFALYYDKQQ